MPPITEVAKDASIKNVEHYEDLRSALDADVNSIKNEFDKGNQDQYNFYLNLAKDALKKQGFKAREGKHVELELIRFCLYLEDQELLETLPEWLMGSLERNTIYYNKFFRPYAYSDQEKLEFEVPVADIKKREYQPLRVIEGGMMTDTGSSGIIDPEEFDSLLEQHVDRLRNARTQQIQESIQEITKRLLNSDFSNQTDVVIAIAENKALRQMVSICLNRLNVSMMTTQVTDSDVQSKRTNFEPGQAYSLEQYKNGIAQAVITITDLQAAQEENKKAEAKLKTSESEKAQATRDAAKLRAEVETLKKELEKETNKPAIKDAKVLLYRIAWVDQGKRYYLGTSSNEDEKIPATNTYPIRSLIKTTVKKESMVFDSIEDLKTQLDKAIKLYNKIDRKQLISLEHLKNCFVVSLLEYIDHGIVKKTIVKNIL
jgi:hypothetical protein